MTIQEKRQVLLTPTTSRHSWLIDILALAALIALFYLCTLGSYPIFTPDEGRYSEVAREMIASGDYVTPRVNGVAFMDKPVLYYWLQASAILLFGLSEWALRFFPALFGILGCLMTYICGRHLFNRRTGLLGAIILASTPLYFGGAHYANLDLEVAVLISCTLLCFITAVQHKNHIQPYFLFAAYLFSGLAFLTKGLIGIAFPALIAGTWIMLLGRWYLLKRIHLLAGILMVAAINLPWFVMVQQANPEFLHFFFITQQIGRFLSHAEFNSKAPLWFYAPVILIGLLAWGIFFLQTLKENIQAIWASRQQHANQLYLTLWFFIILIFFSIPSSKLVGYILPVFPAAALLIAKYIADRWEPSACIRKSFYGCLGVNIVLLLLLVNFASHLNTNSAKPLVSQLKALRQPGEEVIHYFKYFYDVPLYLGEKVTLVANWDAPDIEEKDNWVRELWYGMRFQDTTDWLIKEDNFWQRWNSDKRVFVFINENYLDQFKAGTSHYHVIGRENDIILLSNQAS